MHNDLLVGLALVIVLGVMAQWVAWRIKMPSILLLLITGIIAGPVTGILNVDALLGDLLFPVVSLSVAIILFEGGLSLRLEDIKGSRQVVRNLVSFGVIATWLISGVAAYFLLDLSLELSMLLGATLVVTGPTVIIPLLKQIRPAGGVSSILRWEGIVIDPVGAVLAVLVFEEIIASGPHLWQLIGTLIFTIIIGIGLGYASARAMIELYSRGRVPDSLQIPTTIMFVLAAFTLSNVLEAESGLITATVMGIVMANQKRIDVHHIIEFKETLQVLLLSLLFVLLSARLNPADLLNMQPGIILFIAIMIFVERPLAVWVSTIGSDLTWQEKIFIAWMAPRGIVAASVASIFALELAEHGEEGAELLVPYTFAVIITTVALYSLTSGYLARVLGLSDKFPQGLLIVGANHWIRNIAIEIKQAGFRVILADTNQTNTDRAREAGLEVYNGSILSEAAMDEINFGGIGRLLAMTSNDEVNALACEQFSSTFGGDNVYQLQRFERSNTRETLSEKLGGSPLFNQDSTYQSLSMKFHTGFYATTFAIADKDIIQRQIPDQIMPLFIIEGSDKLHIWCADDPPALHTGDTLIGLVNQDYVTTSPAGKRRSDAIPESTSG